MEGFLNHKGFGSRVKGFLNHKGLRIVVDSIPRLISPVMSVGVETINTIPLTWTDPNIDPNEVNFELQRSADGLIGWATIDSPVQDDTAYDDIGLNEGETWYYRIRAVGDGAVSRTSAYSGIVDGTTVSSSSSIIGTAIIGTALIA